MKKKFSSANKIEDLNDKNQKIEQQKQQQKSKFLSDISKKEGQKEKKKFDKSILDED